MKKWIFGLIALAMFTFACRKRAIVAPEANTSFPMKVGSYWVYQTIKRDAVQAPTQLVAEFDSTVITRDTLIRGENFKIFVQFIFDDRRNLKGIYRSILRDSAEHVIDPYGNKYYFPETRTDILRRDTVRDFNNGGREIARLFYTFENRDSVVKVPAGEFRTINFQTRFQFQAPYASGCKGCADNQRYRHSHYAKGIGKVFEIGVGDYTNFAKYGKQLIRYKIAQ